MRPRTEKGFGVSVYSPRVSLSRSRRSASRYYPHSGSARQTGILRVYRMFVREAPRGKGLDLREAVCGDSTGGEPLSVIDPRMTKANVCESVVPSISIRPYRAAVLALPPPHRPAPTPPPCRIYKSRQNHSSPALVPRSPPPPFQEEPP